MTEEQFRHIRNWPAFIALVLICLFVSQIATCEEIGNEIKSLKHEIESLKRAFSK